MSRLGCIVLAEPRDGSPAIPFIGSTATARIAAERAKSQPEKYRAVTVATVFERVTLEQPE